MQFCEPVEQGILTIDAGVVHVHVLESVWTRVCEEFVEHRYLACISPITSNEAKIY